MQDEVVREISSRVAAIGTWGLVILGGLGTAGIDTSPLLTGLGVGGAALGFAAKEIGANFMAGVLMAVNRNRNFGHGQRLKVGLGSNSVEGIVTGWDLRYLTLLDDKGQRVLVPNSFVFGAVITVENHQPKRRPHDGDEK